MRETAHTFRLQALIVRHTNFGEADRIVLLFSKEQGKVRAIAKGTRKINSRKAGHLEPFTHSRIFLARSRDMPIITQAQTIDEHNILRSDLVKIGYASYVVELIDRFSSENEANYPLFQLSIETIKRIENSQDLHNPIRYFEMHLLGMTGFKPELFACVKCKRIIQAEDQYFSAELGGVLCPQCGSTAVSKKWISMTALKYLRHIQRNAYSKIIGLKIDSKFREEMETLMHHYITFLLERRLNSTEFIKVIEQLRTNSHKNSS